MYRNNSILLSQNTLPNKVIMNAGRCVIHDKDHWYVYTLYSLINDLLLYRIKSTGSDYISLSSRSNINNNVEVFWTLTTKTIRTSIFIIW